MSSNDTLLQYCVALNWAREIVTDIDNGKAVCQKKEGKGPPSDSTAEMRQHQPQVIDILVDLIEANNQQKTSTNAGVSI